MKTRGREARWYNSVMKSKMSSTKRKNTKQGSGRQKISAKNKKLIIIVGAVLIVAAVFAVVLVATRNTEPSKQDVDNDQKISDDLGEIAWKIYDYALENEALPVGLSDVEGRLPELNRGLENYSYRVVDEHSYRMCTDGFRVDTKDYEGVPDGYNDYDRDWGVHDSGRSCWEPKEYWDENAKELYEFRKNESRK